MTRISVIIPVRIATLSMRACFLAMALALSGCVPAGTPFPISDSAPQIEVDSAMLPVVQNCPGTNGPVGGFEPLADLYWLARCDLIRVRWSRYAFMGPGLPGGSLDLCNLPPNNFIATHPGILLVEFPGGMSGTGTTLVPYNGFVGCEPRNDRVPPGFPADVMPTRDARLELRLDLPDLLVVAEPSLSVAVVGTMPRTMAPRVMIPSRCEALGDPGGSGEQRCVKQEHQWQVPIGASGSQTLSEDFSLLLRVRNVRILRGRIVGRALPGIEGALAAETGFECSLDPAGQCIVVRPQYIEVSGPGGRCHFDAAESGMISVDFLSNCRDDLGNVRPVNATPSRYLDVPAAAGKRPVWSIQFEDAAGFPLPELDAANGEVLAIEFTIVSL